MPATTTVADRLRTLAAATVGQTSTLKVYINTDVRDPFDKRVRLHLNETCGQTRKMERSWTVAMKGEFCQRCAKDTQFTADQSQAIAAGHIATAARDLLGGYNPFSYGSLRDGHGSWAQNYLKQADRWSDNAGNGPHPLKELYMSVVVDMKTDRKLTDYAGGVTTLAELGATFVACSTYTPSSDQIFTISGSTPKYGNRFNENLLQLAASGIEPAQAIRMMLYSVPTPKPELSMLPQKFRTRRRQGDTTETWLLREYDLHRQQTIDDIADGFARRRDELLYADTERHCVRITVDDKAASADIEHIDAVIGGDRQAKTAATSASGARAALNTLPCTVEVERLDRQGFVCATLMELVALGAACHRSWWMYAQTARWAPVTDTLDTKAQYGQRLASFDGIDDHVAEQLAHSRQMRLVALSLWVNDGMNFEDAANAAVLAMTPTPV